MIEEDCDLNEIVRRLGKGEESSHALEKATENGSFIEVEVERSIFERKRRWKITSPRGELTLDTGKVAISPGDIVETDDGLLVLVRRQKEKLVIFELGDSTEAFSLGFQLGNLHARVMVGGTTISTPAILGEDLYLEKFAKHHPKFRAGDFEPNI